MTAYAGVAQVMADRGHLRSAARLHAAAIVPLYGVGGAWQNPFHAIAADRRPRWASSLVPAAGDGLRATVTVTDAGGRVDDTAAYRLLVAARDQLRGAGFAVEPVLGADGWRTVALHITRPPA